MNGSPRKVPGVGIFLFVGITPVSENHRVGQAHSMGIGIGIFVVALGAVLAFAVDWNIGGLDLKDVGWILMIAGVVGLILVSALYKRRLEAEAVTSTRKRPVADAPGTNDDHTPLPPATAMTTVPPPAESVTPPTPQPTAPAHVTGLRASAPVDASAPGRSRGTSRR